MKTSKAQSKITQELLKKLQRYHLAILSGEVRSGKTLPIIEVCATYSNPLIITQKNAIPGIKPHTDATVTNFHQVKNLEGEFDIVVIDEAHRWVSGYPKRSQFWKDVRRFTDAGVDMIFSSGTMTPETYASLFNMLALSDHSPFKKFVKFTDWFGVYGKPYQIMINGFPITKYDKTHETVILRKIRKHVVTFTRKEAGHLHEAVDKPILINLSKKQERLYHVLTKDMLMVKGDDVILADTPAKLISKKHQISGGFCHGEDGYVLKLKKNPKLEWCLKNVDPENTIILAHYVEEQKLLAEHFPNTGSTTKNAEGVDYSHFKHMVIFSFGFSAATYEQVRARQMNLKRTSGIEVSFLLCGIDNYVYQAVQSKKNFTASWYAKNEKD